jgi:hypothetical protein
LAAGQLQRIGPGLEQRVVVERLAPAAGGWESSFTWRDETPREGVNPYWIWVTQADGELAWSSPIYVTWQPEKSVRTGLHGSGE